MACSYIAWRLTSPSHAATAALCYLLGCGSRSALDECDIPLASGCPAHAGVSQAQDATSSLDGLALYSDGPPDKSDASLANTGANPSEDASAVQDSSTSDIDATSSALVAQCQGGGNILFVDGDPGEISHAGRLILGPDAGTWYGHSAGYGIEVGLWPTDTQYGDAWIINFSSQNLGAPLALGLYDSVQLFPANAPGYAGMYIEGGWQACGNISGWFAITEILVSPPQSMSGTQALRSLTAAFEQHCNGEVPALRGCVRFQN